MAQRGPQSASPGPWPFLPNPHRAPAQHTEHKHTWLSFSRVEVPKDTGRQSKGARFRTRGSAFGRSTNIVLHLEDDQQEYLDEKRVKGLVKKLSQFVNYPISLWIEKTTEKDIPDDEPDEDDEDEDVSLNIEVEVEEDDEKKLRRSPTSGG